MLFLERCEQCAIAGGVAVVKTRDSASDDAVEAGSFHKKAMRDGFDRDPNQRLEVNADQLRFNPIPVPLDASILTNPLPLPKPKP